MSRNELFQKIKDAYEMVIEIDDRKFTICDENENGFSIAEWYKPETEKYFRSPEEILDEYKEFYKNQDGSEYKLPFDEDEFKDIKENGDAIWREADLAFPDSIPNKPIIPEVKQMYRLK